MLSEKVLDYIKRNELIEEDDRILVAFSGGSGFPCASQCLE